MQKSLLRKEYEQPVNNLILFERMGDVNYWSAEILPRLVQCNIKKNLEGLQGEETIVCVS